MQHLRTLAAGSVLVLASGPAFSAGFAVAYQSVSALGSAFAGAAAVSDNASNQWFNPATLAGIERTQLSVAIHQVLVDTDFNAQGASGPGNFKDLEPVIPAGYLAVPINDWLTFGLGLTTPFGSKIEYEDNWGNALSPTGVPASGDFYSTFSDLRAYNLNPALAVQVTDRLQLGVGISYQRLEADIRNAVTRLEGDDEAFGWNVGMTYQPDDANHFGVAYRSAIRYDIEGDITFSESGLAASGIPAPVAAQLAGSYDGSAKVEMPASLQLSYMGILSERTRLLLGVEWTEWSSLDELRVNHEGPAPLPNPAVETFNWRNSARYSVGLNVDLNPQTVLRFGVAEERSTQRTDNRSAISPDSNRTWLTLGAGFTPSENVSLDIAYAHIMVDDADVNRSDKGVPLVGTYELAADVLAAQLTYTF